MRPRNLTFLFIITIVFLLRTAFAQTPALQTALNLSSEPASLPDFAALPYEEADRMVTLEAGKHVDAEYIAKLVRQINGSALNNDKMVLAVYLLGELRPNDPDSVGALIRLVDLRALRMDPKGDSVRWGWYPAQEALVKIGEPAIEPVLKQLAIETDARRLRLLCGVLTCVKGRDGLRLDIARGNRAALELIQREIRDETAPSRKANLEAAIKHVGEEEPGYPKPKPSIRTNFPAATAPTGKP